MEQQIRRFVDDFVFLPALSRNCHLAGFLHDFLENSIDPAFQQFRSIGLARRVTLPLLDCLVETFENTAPRIGRLRLRRVQSGKEASPFSRMTGWTNWLDLHEKGIAVT